MSRLPPAWDHLAEILNGRPGRLGTPGVRDPDGICEVFDGQGYDGSGRCQSDGHYLCVECSELAPDSPRFLEYGAAGRLDRLRARAATRERRKP